MKRTNVILGFLSVGVAAILLLVWIPMDVDGGIVAKVRGDYAIGDALAPTLAAGLIFVAGLMLVLAEGRAETQQCLTRANLGFIGAIFAVLVCGGVLMRYAGPVAVWAFTDGAEYRVLRDTFPWKYLGFVLGGMSAVAGMICIVEGKAGWRALAVGLMATLAIVALYDLPFEDLLLPPNGDF